MITINTDKENKRVTWSLPRKIPPQNSNNFHLYFYYFLLAFGTVDSVKFLSCYQFIIQVSDIVIIVIRHFHCLKFICSDTILQTYSQQRKYTWFTTPVPKLNSGWYLQLEIQSLFRGPQGDMIRYFRYLLQCQQPIICKVPD